MQSTNTTRDKLIATGLRALMTQGYDGAGIGPILTEAGVPKGSFYHYFASKDDFTAAVIDAYAAHYSAGFQVISEDPALTPMGVLQAYFEWLGREIEEAFPNGGCLYGVMAQTIAMRSEALREKLQTVFREWEERLAAVLEKGRACGELSSQTDIGEAVAVLIDAYEGAIIRVKAEGSTAAFERFRRRIPRLLQVAV